MVSRIQALRAELDELIKRDTASHFEEALLAIDTEAEQAMDEAWRIQERAEDDGDKRVWWTLWSEGLLPENIADTLDKALQPYREALAMRMAA